MKLTLMALVTLSAFSFAAPRTIEVTTEKIGDAVHWSPAKIEVAQGEQVVFHLTHKLEGGFDFHGFFIPQLNVSSQVSRNDENTNVPVTIPKSLKAGEYKIGCQFHPKHVPATLVVKAAAPAAH